MCSEVTRGSVQLTQYSVITCNVHAQIRNLQSSSIMLSLVLHSRPPGSLAVITRVLLRSKNLFCNVKTLNLVSPPTPIETLLLPVK